MTNNRHFLSSVSWSIEWFCVWIKICVSTATFLPQTVFIYKCHWKITEWQNHTCLRESNDNFDNIYITCVYRLYIYFYHVKSDVWITIFILCNKQWPYCSFVSAIVGYTRVPKLMDLCQFSVGAWRLGQWSPPGAGASYVWCNQLWQRCEEKVDCRQCTQTAPQGCSSCFHKFCYLI